MDGLKSLLKILGIYLVTVIFIIFGLGLVNALGIRVTSKYNGEGIAESSSLQFGEFAKQLITGNDNWKANSANVHLVVKPKLEFQDAVVNLLFVIVNTLACIFIGVPLALALFVKGVITANWGAVILGLLGVIVMVFLPFFSYFPLLFQNCTPAYFILMVIPGLPLLLLPYPTTYIIIVRT